MLDDSNFDICNGKHYGPILYIEGDCEVMRCSFCEQLFKNTVPASKEFPKEDEPKRRSSKLCMQACDWVTCEKIVTCNSCGYTGPLP